MSVEIRKFKEEDIPYKVRWINDSENNKYLHYDLPLELSKTLAWYKTLGDRQDRIDYTITYNGEPAGLIGLLDIDLKNRKAEFYICLGGKRFKGKGIASVATDLIIKESYKILSLNKIYLYTEVENVVAQRLFEKIGFVKEGLLKQDLIYNGRKIDRYIYGLSVEEYVAK